MRRSASDFESGMGRGVKNGTTEKYDSTRYTPIHRPHSTDITGFMSILHGDVRFYNNVFVQQSVREKMARIGVPMTVENVERELSDVAGVRIICSFVDDIYKLADMLALQDDIYILKTKDYIKNPKPSGYRSLHLIVEIPIFLAHEKRFMRVEVQLRTIAMDFWASLEHKLHYKKDIPPEYAQDIARQLRECAKAVSDTDAQMLSIRRQIEGGSKP